VVVHPVPDDRARRGAVRVVQGEGLEVVVEHREPAARAQHAHHLVVRERQRVDVLVYEVDSPAAAPGRRRHRVADVRRDHVRTVIGQFPSVVAGAAAGVQHGPSGKRAQGSDQGGPERSVLGDGVRMNLTNHDASAVSSTLVNCPTLPVVGKTLWSGATKRRSQVSSR
jgi:hypothetical protein